MIDWASSVWLCLPHLHHQVLLVQDGNGDLHALHHSPVLVGQTVLQGGEQEYSQNYF